MNSTTPPPDSKVQSETPRQIAEKIVNDLQSGPNGIVFHTTRTYESNRNIARSLINSIEAALHNERERCAQAICLFCAEPEHYGPPKEIEGSKRLWHADLRNDCNGVVQCQAAAIRERR